jgi:hypothetical protein
MTTAPSMMIPGVRNTSKRARGCKRDAGVFVFRRGRVARVHRTGRFATQPPYGTAGPPQENEYTDCPSRLASADNLS